MLKIICCIYSHQRAVFTSSLSQSSLTSVPACWTRFKSTLYNEDGSKTSTFLTNDSLSFLGKKKHEILKYLIDSYCIDRFYWRDQLQCGFVESWKEFTWGRVQSPEDFFLYSNTAAVTSCQKGLSRCVLLSVVLMSNGDCWFCHNGWKLCWLLLLNILVQYASYSNYHREGLFGT